MTNKAETEIQKTILVALTAAFHPIGVFWRQNAGKVKTERGGWVGLGPTGIADIVGSMEGRLLFREVKTPTGRQRAAQKAFEIALTRTGADYALVRSAPEAVESVWAVVAPTPAARAAMEARIQAARAALKAGPKASGRARRKQPAPSSSPAVQCRAPAAT